MKKLADGRGPSLAGRYAAAIVLTVGFYFLALALAGALIGLPLYALVVNGEAGLLTIFAAVTGGVILAAIAPRRQAFPPPGPRITALDEPRLMAAIEAVARATGERAPDVVYADLHVNAGVTELSNGFLRGRRRVLVVGLPLLHVVSERGFRAVVAHELGHYAGGDTRLGPWVWRTRGTIGRTIATLDGGGDYAFRSVRLPFIAYGRAFIALTDAISRRQELAADAFAARATGRDAYAGALRSIAAQAHTFDTYWDEEVVPLLSMGFLPPLLAGYASFMRSERSRAAAAAQLEHRLAVTRSDGTHPALPQRLAALAALPAGAPDDSPPAYELLDDEAALERRFDGIGGLAPVRWDELVERFWLPHLSDLVERHAGALDGITAGSLGMFALDPTGVARAIGRAEPELAGRRALEMAPHVLAAGLTLAFVRAGWRLEAQPGCVPSVLSGDDAVTPTIVVLSLGAGERTPEEWSYAAATYGIADEPLAATASLVA